MVVPVSIRVCEILRLQVCCELFSLNFLARKMFDLLRMLYRLSGSLIHYSLWQDTNRKFPVSVVNFEGVYSPIAPFPCQLTLFIYFFSDFLLFDEGQYGVRIII